jgi:DNA primase
MAAIIADPDLSQSYRQDLLARFEGLWRLDRPAQTYDDAARAFRAGRKGRAPVLTGPTPEGRAAARKLSASMRPMSAAIAQTVIRLPDLIDGHFEQFEVQGFGDPTLERFAKEIIRIRLAEPALDSASLGRHLASLGFEDVLKEIARAAALARADFNEPDMPSDRARADWSRAYEGLIQEAALDRAITDAKSEDDFDFDAFKAMKTERDLLRRRIASGDIGAAEPPFEEAALRH